MNYLVAVDASFVHSPGGMARVAWDMALAVRDRGHQVAMICAYPYGSQRQPEVELVQGVRIAHYRRPSIPSWDPRFIGRTMANVREALDRCLGQQRWDVVHTHSLFTGLGALLALGPGPRYVSTLHSPVVLETRIGWREQGGLGRLKRLLGGPLLWYLERRLLSGSQQLHSLSRYTRASIGRFHADQARRIQVIPHWCRQEQRRTLTRRQARQQLGWPADRPILFTVRIHGPRYGLDDAIAAIGPLTRSRGCRFYVGGDGPLRPRLEQQTRELGCAEGVRFMGRIPDETLALAYQAADLFVLPTRELECFGLIILEALSYGCPVLSTDAAAIPETMRPILPRLVVPAGDAAAMGRAVERWLDHQLPLPSEQQLVQYTVDHYSPAVILPRLHQLLGT